MWYSTSILGSWNSHWFDEQILYVRRKMTYVASENNCQLDDFISILSQHVTAAHRHCGNCSHGIDCFPMFLAHWKLAWDFFLDCFSPISYLLVNNNLDNLQMSTIGLILYYRTYLSTILYYRTYLFLASIPLCSRWIFPSSQAFRDDQVRRFGESRHHFGLKNLKKHIVLYEYITDLHGESWWLMLVLDENN